MQLHDLMIFMNTIIVKKDYYLRIIDIIVRLKTTNRYFLPTRQCLMNLLFY